MDYCYNNEEESVHRQSLFPTEDFFIPDEYQEREARNEAIESIEGSETIVLSDNDIDGLGVLLAVRQVHDVDTLGYVPCGPRVDNIELNDVFELVATHADETANVYIGDICPDTIDDVDNIEHLSNQVSNVVWVDHHEWDEIVEDFVQGVVDELIVYTDNDPELCAAEIMRDYLDEGYSTDYSDQMNEALTVTGIYDNWKKIRDEDGNKTEEFVDERARDLDTLHHAVNDYSDYIEYVEAVGADVMSLPEARDIIQNSREVQKEYDALATARAEFDHHSVTIAHTYGRCSQNDVADKLKEEGADVVAVVKPSGGISLRGTEDSFELCHLVAERLNGGGRGLTAGGYVPPRNDGVYSRDNTDMLDYMNHWSTNGERIRNKVVSEIREVIIEEELDD